MKKIILSIILTLAPQFSFAAVPDSIARNLEDYDYLTNFTEKNYAVFDAIQELGYGKEYRKLRDKLRKKLQRGKMGIEKAFCEYAFWFHLNFDSHYFPTYTPMWKQYWERAHTDYATLFDYAPKPVSCKVDDTAWLIRFPSCDLRNPTEEWMQQAVKDFLASRCENLIIDVRGNGGGDSRIWYPLSGLVINKQGECVESMFLITQYNLTVMEDEFKNNPYNKPENEDYKQMVNETLQKIDEWKRTLQEKGGTEEFIFGQWAVNCGHNSTRDYPKKVAIIVDRGTASAAEDLVLQAKWFSNKTKIYGKDSTYGADMTGNCIGTKLPNSDHRLFYPTCIFQFEFLDHHKFGTVGIVPDRKIDLPYPKQLTDNTDEWVLWVASDLKKQ